MVDNTKISINKIKINNNAMPGSIESTLFNISTVVHIDKGNTIIINITIDNNIIHTLF